jgi:hypothetical protein
MAATPNSSTPAVVVTQEPRWTAFSAGTVEIDLTSDGRGCVAALGTVLNLNDAADLAVLGALAQLLEHPQIRAAIGLS